MRLKRRCECKSHIQHQRWRSSVQVRSESPFNRRVGNRQIHQTVNLAPSGIVGSTPTSPTIYAWLVKWLRHRPFTAVTRVRIPLVSPETGFPQLSLPSDCADTSLHLHPFFLVLTKHHRSQPCVKRGAITINCVIVSTLGALILQ